MKKVTWKSLAVALFLGCGVLVALVWANEVIEMATYIPTVPAGGAFRNMQYFRSSGAWTVPNGVTKILVEVWGAGGGGGSSIGGGYPAGGGSGAYGMGIFDVASGAAYTVTVGSGGGANQDGGSSSFGNLISAGGGRGAPGGEASVGGAGGTSSAPFNISGQAGGGFVKTNITAPGGSGGSAPRGGPGAPISHGNAIPGIAPGGGGGSSGYVTGGRGADGGVLVWW